VETLGLTLDQLLKENIRREIQNIPQETFLKENMAMHLQAVIGQRGACIEHMWYKRPQRFYAKIFIWW
jgi:hypothetical protein